ncbi:hypothetical protein Cgig2_001573 [Carnegiea gigantea]|uniref:Uncharacterized protein n=1 Tax=Carnegiea gigantea TaxID=171969 RepID=A0A9Q1Q8A5_9CARY|nr:hypothetical protein Cgig2_001573 [Carnegiea gigantea]
MAPEMIRCKAYGRKFYAHSFGLLLPEMTSGRIPFDRLSPPQAACARHLSLHLLGDGPLKLVDELGSVCEDQEKGFLQKMLKLGCVTEYHKTQPNRPRLLCCYQTPSIVIPLPPLQDCPNVQHHQENPAALSSTHCNSSAEQGQEAVTLFAAAELGQESQTSHREYQSLQEEKLQQSGLSCYFSLLHPQIHASLPRKTCNFNRSNESLRT